MSTDNIKFELLEVMVLFVHETIKIGNCHCAANDKVQQVKNLKVCILSVLINNKKVPL